MPHQDRLPDDFLAKWPGLEYVRYHRGSDTFTSSCPICGSSGHDNSSGWPDRFVMFLDAPRLGHCRKCGFQDFVYSHEKITPELRQKSIEKLIRQQEERKAEVERVLDGLRREQIWLKYHEALTDQAMEWWASKGLPAEIVSLLYLGWCEAKSFWNGNQEFYATTATIPVFSPGWQIQALRHRLITPNTGCKYRPECKGLLASLYYSNPKTAPTGQCLIVEGEIKSAVVNLHLGGYEDTSDMFVVGTPGKSFRMEILDPIKANCDRIWIALDPDAKLQGWRTAEYVGESARLVRLPCKADDFFTIYGGSKRDFIQALEYGRQI